MNEWGIPDWRDPSAHGEVKGWGFIRWRWEFYRRRQDLRDFFDRWSESACSEQFALNAGKRPSDPGFRAVKSVDMQEELALFGYSGVPNPRIGDQPREVIVPDDVLLKGVPYYDPAELTPSNYGQMSVIELIRWNEHKIILSSHEYAMKFDLNKPLAKQLHEARVLLELKQSRLHGRLIQRRRHKGKWLGYLRTLDAHADGASLSEIASLHPNSARTEQTGRDMLAQARALCFNF
jgi:hypothetical protein